MEANTSGFIIRNLNTNRTGARNWRLDADFVLCEIQGKITVKRRNLADFHASRWTERILRNARANVGTLNFDVNTELLKRILNNCGIIMSVARVRRRALFVE